MRVPTTDYSPLRQANATKVSAQRTQFIAPNIDYQSRSLARKQKGLQSDLSYLKSMETLQSIKFINTEMTKLVSQGLAMQEAKQGQQAQSMTNQMSQDLDTFIQQGFANGDFYYEYADVDTDPTHNTGGQVQLQLHGADKIQAFKDQQMKTLQDQGWFSPIEQGAMDSMEGVYYNMNSNMARNFYAKEAQDKFKLEQMNLQSAIESDMADPTATGFRRTDAFLSSLKGYTPEAIAMMTQSAHSQVDLGRAANNVRTTATSQGTQAGVDYANSISYQRGCTPETRQKLISYAHSAGNQAKFSAMNEGMQFMDTEIQNAQANGTAPDFASLWKQKREENSGLPKEQRDSYEAGMEKSQMDYLRGRYDDLTKDLDTMTLDELQQAIDNLPNIEGEFEGTPSTKALYDNIKGSYAKKMKEYESIIGESIKGRTEGAENLILNNTSLINDVVSDVESGLLSGNDAIEKISDILQTTESKIGDTPIDAKKWLDFENLANKSIKAIALKKVPDGAYKNVINESVKNIDTAVRGLYGEDLTQEQSDKMEETITKAKGSLIDLAMDSSKLSEADFRKRANAIVSMFNGDIYGRLTATPQENSSGVKKYSDAMDITSAYEDNPEAVYFEENLAEGFEEYRKTGVAKNTGKYVWLDDSMRQSFDNAARLEQDMLHDVYGIDIDYTKRPEYGSITEKRMQTDAEEKGLVPIFTDKRGKKYTVQGGKVYRYWNGRGLPIVEAKDTDTQEQIQIQQNTSNYKNQH